MKYCEKCGTQLPDEAAFCSTCGKACNSESVSTITSDKPATKKNVCGILSFIFGIVTAFPLLLYLYLYVIMGASSLYDALSVSVSSLLFTQFSVPSIVLGIIGITKKEKKVFPIIGLSLSGFAIVFVLFCYLL